MESVSQPGSRRHPQIVATTAAASPVVAATIPAATATAAAAAATMELVKKPRTAVMESLEDIAYGSIAGVVGKYIEYPFDTVKVRLQSQPDHLPLRYKGPLDCFRQSIRADGFLGLYRGISAPLVGAALETSSLFFFERIGREAVYSSGHTPRDQALSLPALWFTGAFSGAFTSFILTPIELVKCKIQVPETPAAGKGAAAPPPLRPIPVIKDIFRHEGLMGFWHGQMGTLIREAGGCAAWFGFKETTTKLLRDWNETRWAATMKPAELEIVLAEPLPLWQQAVAGASAGMSYNFLFFPADTVKSRMQTSPIGGDGTGAAKRSFGAETAALWRQAGIKGFYRGCGVTVLRSAPSSAFIFMVFDGLKNPGSRSATTRRPTATVRAALSATFVVNSVIVDDVVSAIITVIKKKRRRTYSR
ncbi:putative mitochondrial ornithine carrier protein [Apodospora peruviana]|uniref:Mitochondrial ornithine carrier protein n=1 Tax=Apodospora peruviana TaxID=516989 RepID=A0AAE0IQE1_9PEZI|nr:putative mitochondrial ornithine carrier protein [Apodospora peruviana]